MKDLEPGMVYRRVPEQPWKICLTVWPDPYDTEFLIVRYLREGGKITATVYFLNSMFEVVE